MTLLCLGLNYRTCPVELRERLDYDQAKLDRAYAMLGQLGEVREACVLSTCHRNELYVVGEDGLTPERLSLLFHAVHEVSEGLYAPYCYQLAGAEMVRHLFKVASGLDSMVLGEAQISGQVKASFREALARGTIGRYLDRLFSRAFNVNKVVRLHTAIGEGRTSLAYIGVDIAAKVFSSLRDRKVLVVGAGEMGRLAARHLAKQGCRSLFISNRTKVRAEELAQAVGGDVVPFADLKPAVDAFDMVIVALPGGATPLISATDLQPRREGGPRLFVDLSVPRSLDPAIAELEGCFLYNIDELQPVVDRNQRRREAQLDEALHLVELELERFFSWIETRDVETTIRQLRERLESFRSIELDRVRHRLDTEQLRLLDEVTRRCMNKFLHPALAELKAEAQGHGGGFFKDAVRKVYCLDDLEKPTAPEVTLEMAPEEAPKSK
ncbi:MAG: glutamyl-tRNA reductase [Deltaproteobacteria bacterium RIFOXYA12_FULL_61_11]|nr:MAG: glutamyl-tRNA reductase [Deltaproteobacteria bacterium RIFOXYA12_FULL_61_11]